MKTGSKPAIDGFTDLVRIDHGGSSTVYSAHDERHGRDVAIKLLTTTSLDPTIQESFSREVKAMGQLGDHPNIMPVFHSGFAQDGSPFLVMPLLSNGSYARQIKTHGAMNWADVVDVAIKILSALETAHQRHIIHRDIKPANLFVGHYESQPLLGDFGISTLADSEKTATKASAYTLTYAAPEVLEGAKQTVKSDIYSLGITLRELLTAEAAFSAETNAGLISMILTQPPRPLPQNLPSNLLTVLDQMVSRNPDDRPKSCREVAELLQSCQSTPTPILVGDPTKPSESPDPDQSDSHTLAPEGRPNNADDQRDEPTEAPQTETATLGHGSPALTTRLAKNSKVYAAVAAASLVVAAMLLTGWHISGGDEAAAQPANGSSTDSGSSNDSADADGASSPDDGGSSKSGDNDASSPANDASTDSVDGQTAAPSGDALGDDETTTPTNAAGEPVQEPNGQSPDAQPDSPQPANPQPNTPQPPNPQPQSPEPANPQPQSPQPKSPAPKPAPAESAFVGTWEGTISQPNVSNYGAVIKIRETSAGLLIGTSDYPGLNCGGGLTQVSVRTSTLRVREMITYGTGCINVGYIDLTKRSDGSMLFEWFRTQNSGRNESSGILRKVS